MCTVAHDRIKTSPWEAQVMLHCAEFSNHTHTHTHTHTSAPLDVLYLQRLPQSHPLHACLFFIHKIFSSVFSLSPSLPPGRFISSILLFTHSSPLHLSLRPLSLNLLACYQSALLSIVIMCYLSNIFVPDFNPTYITFLVDRHLIDKELCL